MDLLAFGDLHLKSAGAGIQYDQLYVPEQTDAVVVVGDIVHRAEPDELAVGRKFFERLDEAGVPVVVVPGNHDPHEHYPTMIDGCQNVVNAHGRVVTGDAFTHLGDAPLSGLQVVGWGCEQFDFTTEIDVTAIPPLDPTDERNPHDRDYQADQAAQAVEDAVFDVVAGEATPKSVLDRFDVPAGERRGVLDGIERARSSYETVSNSIAGASASGEAIVLSHVPPYNTSIDRHHAMAREDDRNGLHVGSLGLKLALRRYHPLATLSGHSHHHDYQPGIGDAGQPHVLGLGFQGVHSISVGGTGGFGYEIHWQG